MKVWIVCDNNRNKSGNPIIPFSSLELAQRYQEQYEYDPIKAVDCWIYDEEGTEVKN